MSIIGVVAAVVGLAFSGLFRQQNPPATGDGTISRDDVIVIQNSLVATNKKLAQLEARINAVGKPASPSKLAAEVGEMRKASAQMRGDLSALQGAILENPAKAIELPLLKKDLESARAAGQTSIAAVQQDLDRQYELMKWIVGTFAVGIGGMVLTVLLPAIRDVRSAGDSTA